MSLRLPKSVRLASVVLVALGCGGEPLMVELTRPPDAVTTFTSVPVGATSIGLILTNRSVTSWEYGGCSHSLDRMTLTDWATVHDGSQVLCAAVGYALRPGESVTLDIPLPPEAGTYRIRFDFMHFPNDRVEYVEVTSNQFRVAAYSLPAAR